MKVKMKVIKKSDRQKIGNDKASRNLEIQSSIPEMARRKMALKKKQDGLIASWMSPSKYKGFKLKIK